MENYSPNSSLSSSLSSYPHCPAQAGRPDGTFLHRLKAQIDSEAWSSVESDLVIAELLEMVAGKEVIDERPKALLDLLDLHTSEEKKRHPSWPRTARDLNGRIRLFAPALRKLGLFVRPAASREEGGSKRVYLAVGTANLKDFKRAPGGSFV